MPITTQFFPKSRDNFPAQFIGVQGSVSPGPNLPQAFPNSQFYPIFIPQHTLTWTGILLFFTNGVQIISNQPEKQMKSDPSFF